MNDVRKLFPGASDKVYLDISLRGLLPESTRAAVIEYLDARVSGDLTKAMQWDAVERARTGFAGLIGATADEVAVTKNVSEGLNLFAGSLPWKAGDNVVICPELEHPNNIYLWYNLRSRVGVEVRAVAPDDGRLPVDFMIASMDARTRVVTLPHISFSPGFLSDVATVGAAARERGVLTLVDAAQSVGSVRTDVGELGVDALVTATQKSLLALYGTGFLFIRRELADSLVPCAVARYGIALDAGDETAYDPDHLRFAPGARRFDLGNFNYLGATAAAASLDLIAGIGIERIERHVRRLAARLAAGLADLGLPVASGPPGPHLAHIVAVGTSGAGRHDSAEDPAMNELHEHLTRNGVRLSIRRGVLRFSVGIYNDDADIDRVVELASTWQRARS